MYLTVFTPAYNRESTLKRLYESLNEQTNKKFEWLIVDDGSVDNTYETLVEFSKKEKAFPIRIIKQQNSGKHVAVNTGVDNANGDLFFIVDSDDYLPGNAIEKIYKMFCEITMSEEVIGVSAVKAYSDNKIVGKSFKSRENEFIEITNLDRNKYGIVGDRAEIYFTEILRKNKFPVFQGEKFISEAVLWNRLAYEGKKLRFINEIIYYCEYQEDGLSNNIQKVFLNNWEGYSYYVNQEIKYRKTFRKKISLLFAYVYLAKEFKKASLKEIILKIDKAPSILIVLTYLFSKVYQKVLGVTKKMIRKE